MSQNFRTPILPLQMALASKNLIQTQCTIHTNEFAASFISFRESIAEERNATRTEPKSGLSSSNRPFLTFGLLLLFWKFHHDSPLFFTAETETLLRQTEIVGAWNPDFPPFDASVFFLTPGLCGHANLPPSFSFHLPTAEVKQPESVEQTLHC